MLLLSRPLLSQPRCFCPCFFFFFLHRISASFSHSLFHSLSVSPFLPLSISPCLCGPPLGWLLLAAPVPPTLSLDMLFIGLQRGWLSVQGGCCLKQCNLNKRGRSSQRAVCLMGSLCFCEQTPCTPINTIHPLSSPSYSELITQNTNICHCCCCYYLILMHL